MVESLARAARVARKEFRGFFASPAAWLFLAAFLAANLFCFFWVESFFARNIADVRPLFAWWPLLAIFLVAALTMRSWSEERRAGTLESLLTAPTDPWALILGKFAAALGLVALSLVLTLPLPLTVAALGPLDWGPVAGGYLASLALAATYVAIGLAMSSRTDNPIVALILTAAVAGAFHLLGSAWFAGLFGYRVGEWLARLGTASRFEAIGRGVLDLGDLVYYLSLTAVFLVFNRLSLERLRWAGNPPSASHRRWLLGAALLAANFAAVNLWLGQLGGLRLDLTRERLYSLSEATRAELARLEEPLLIRGYFSERTHPLLAPLVPQLADLLREYAAAGRGRVRVEIVDPTRDREAEEEAAGRYGIRPVPFQTADRYQAAVVNAYFDVVVSYGDQYEHLGFRDLIEVKARGETSLDVVLKDPEYAVTRAIRKVAGAWAAGGDPLAGLAEQVVLHAYLSPAEQLPEPLRRLRGELREILADLRAKADDKLEVRYADPDAGDGDLARRLREEGLGPLVASLADPRPFWFQLVLQRGEERIPVPLPETLDRAGLERTLNAALRRLTPGVLRTVAWMHPPAFGPDAQRYEQLQKVLEENVRLVETDLKNGQVPAEADLLLLLAPRELDDRQRFAVDQFLMRGGSVVLVTSPFDVQLAGTLRASRVRSGLEEWLEHFGIRVEERLVLDPQSAALPIPVERQVGGLSLLEYHLVPYPFFPDVRGEALARRHPVTANLEQLTFNWVSPIAVDEAKNRGRTFTPLAKSSPQSWTTADPDLVPDFARHPRYGFPPAEERAAAVLAAALEGSFESFYRGKPSPLASLAEENEKEKAGGEDADGAGEADRDKTRPVASGVLERSPASARLLVVASRTFASDLALELVSQGLNTYYTAPLDFLQNAVDWSLEDPALLALRGRTRLARTLAPLSPEEARLFEWLNYGLALVGLGIVWLWRRWVARADRRRYQRILAEV
ncbi:MAG: hypothetical protein KatS3mg124_2069 [Porticoccaceae bacterium]|nr:MAG: hypothetical protein KatS3mg124_2069 [Porticoccaceae bacterium]